MFLQECKNRFLCSVLVNGEIEECYVPNSSKVNKYVNLDNKKVLLAKNKNPGRTRISLFAAKHEKNYIFLNLNMVNNVLKDAVLANNISFGPYDKVYSEKKVEGYKADLVLVNSENKNTTVIEVKGIISLESVAYHPTGRHDRSIKQLRNIIHLLKAGYDVRYVFLVLSPCVKRIVISDLQEEYSFLLKECVRLGMRLEAYLVNYYEHNKEVRINNLIPITLNS